MPIQALPFWYILLDLWLGLVMWLLIVRAAMSVFLPQDSSFFLMKVFVKTTDPVLAAFRPITPDVLVQPLVPLFVAWFFFMIRFYLMPLLLGFSLAGMLSLPFESEIVSIFYSLFGSSP